MKRAALVVAALFALSACSGDDGPAGPQGPSGPSGPSGPTGPAAPIPPGAGLKITLLSATAPATGPATVTFTVTDAADRRVDFLAELAAGAFGSTRGPRWSIAQASVVGGTYDQALNETASAGDPGGKQTRPTSVPASSTTLAVAAALYTANADGSYTFRFPTTAAEGLPTLAAGFPLAPDQAKQTLVGVQASRVFPTPPATGGVSYPVGASFEFIPAGGAVTNRSVVSDAACNNCHGNMQAHGTRRTVNLCLTCHTPGWIQNPTANNTANAIDFRVMIHQIHRGAQPNDPASPAWLYKWGATTDFSHVMFAPPNTVRNCASCHQGGAQSDNWKSAPSRTACSSCHYTVDLEAGTGHGGGACATETDCGGITCTACHSATAITRYHSPLYDPATNTEFVGHTLDITIDKVDYTLRDAGFVEFTVRVDGAPADVRTNPLSQLRFTVAGPTSDYGGAAFPHPGYIQSSNFGGTGATALTVLDAATGKHSAPLPNLVTAFGGAGVALGTQVAVGVEAYILEDVGGVEKEWGQSPTPVKFTKLGYTSATTGSTNGPAPRRQITDNAKCNKCHLDLGFHGGEARKIPEYCAFCHNSRNVNDERTSRFEAPFSKTPNTVQLSVMIHKIHKGGDLANDYALGATRDFRADPTAVPPRAEGEAPPVEFAGAFPGDLKNCMTCHVAGGYGLPESNVLPTRFVAFTCLEDPATDADAVCGTLDNASGQVSPTPDTVNALWSRTENFVGSGAAHCGSCHDTAIAQTHFTANTIAGVESCDVCHGDGRFMDPIELHVPNP